MKITTELVSPRNRQYRSWCSRHKARRNKQEKKHRDPFFKEYNVQLSRWEFVIQSLLRLCSNERQERILKFSDKNSMPSYREIDYISEPLPNQLIFCEIKLKSRFDGALSNKSSGWRQLTTSIEIAKDNFKNLSVSDQ